MADLSDLKKVKPGLKSVVPTEATGLPGAISKLKGGRDLLKEGLGLATDIWSIVKPLVQKKMEQNDSGGNVEMNQPPAKKEDPGPAKQDPGPAPSTKTDKGMPSEKAMVDFFSTLEGRKKLVEILSGIEKQVGSEATIKELKELVEMSIPGDKKQKEKK